MVRPDVLDLCVPLVKRFEGLHRVGRSGLVYPYICPGGYPTIGWGTVVPSMRQPPITREIAEQWMLADLGKFWLQLVVASPSLATERAERGAAILDWTYNLGVGRYRSSTLKRRVDARDWRDAPHQLRRWVYAGGQKLPGLVARREAEAALLG